MSGDGADAVVDVRAGGAVAVLLLSRGSEMVAVRRRTGRWPKRRKEETIVSALYNSQARLRVDSSAVEGSRGCLGSHVKARSRRSANGGASPSKVNDLVSFGNYETA